MISRQWRNIKDYLNKMTHPIQYGIRAYRAALALYFLPIYILLIFGPLTFAGLLYDHPIFNNWPEFGGELPVSFSIIFLFIVGYLCIGLVLIFPLYSIQKKHFSGNEKLSFFSFLSGDPLKRGEVSFAGMIETWLYLSFLSVIVLAALAYFFSQGRGDLELFIISAVVLIYATFSLFQAQRYYVLDNKMHSRKLLLLVTATLVIVLFNLFFFSRNSFSYISNQDMVACTADAKICPDGSAVGRMGPNCEFAECPGDLGLVDIETPAGSSCSVDAECRCKNFNGAEFLPGTYPGQCDLERGVCLSCVYR